MKKSFLHLHLAILLAGFTGVLGKLVTLNEAVLVWYRMLLAACFMLLLSLFRPGIKRLSAKETMKLVSIGAVVAMHWIAFYGSVKYANVSVSLVTFSAIGFFSAWLDPLINRRRPVLLEILLGLMVMAGIYLIFHFDSRFTLGVCFGVLSAFLASLFTILNKKLVPAISSENITFYEMAGGWMVLSIFLPLYFQYFPSNGFLPTASDLLWLAILSILCTVVAFHLSVSALRHISPFTVNLSYNLDTQAQAGPGYHPYH